MRKLTEQEFEQLNKQEKTITILNVLLASDEKIYFIEMNDELAVEYLSECSISYFKVNDMGDYSYIDYELLYDRTINAQ